MDRRPTPRQITARRFVVVTFALVLLLVPSVAGAQQAIALKSIEDPTFGLATVVPEDWTPLGQGIYARLPNGADSVLLAVQSAPFPAERLWEALLPQLDLEAIPEPTGTLATDAFTWTLYQVDVDAPAGALRVDLAIADADGTSYVVLGQSPVEGAAALREAVFVPAVQGLKPLAPEPTVDPATLPYALEDVAFPGGSPDVTLAGTLSVPRTPGLHPAIVLFSGSGAQDRDESLRPVAAIKPFALLADAFTRAGIAVLRYDDRGTASSTGEYAAARLADFTADAAAALAYLRSRPEVDPARVGVLGHSEGGVYTASLIEAGDDLAFAVGMAAPATNGVDLLVAQNGAIVRSSGSSAQDAALAEAFARKLYAAIIANDLVGAENLVRDFFADYYDRQDAELQAALGDRNAFIDAQVQRQIATASAPWFADLLRSDAGIGWGKATVPVLGVFGGKDVQVLADQNAPLMEAQLAGSDPASRVVILPDANHLFQAAKTGSVAEYGTLKQTFTPDFLPLVVDWVRQVVGLDLRASPAP